jgi:hypothetical protein
MDDDDDDNDDNDNCGQPPDILWKLCSDCFELVCNIIKTLFVVK